MSVSYEFKVPEPFYYLKVLLFSLAVIGVYVAIICLILSPDSLITLRGYLFYFGGALWCLALALGLYLFVEHVECEVADDRLTIYHKSKSRTTIRKSEDIFWDHLESYAVVRFRTGISLMMKRKSSGRKLKITIPLFNNDPLLIRQFLEDFKIHTDRQEIPPKSVNEKVIKRKPFYQTLAARIIGYIFIAYLVFILIVKITGLDQGKVPWSNVFSTLLFALLYLTFVFGIRRRD